MHLAWTPHRTIAAWPMAHIKLMFPKPHERLNSLAACIAHTVDRQHRACGLAFAPMLQAVCRVACGFDLLNQWQEHTVNQVLCENALQLIGDCGIPKAGDICEDMFSCMWVNEKLLLGTAEPFDCKIIPRPLNIIWADTQLTSHRMLQHEECRARCVYS